MNGVLVVALFFAGLAATCFFGAQIEVALLRRRKRREAIYSRLWRGFTMPDADWSYARRYLHTLRAGK